MLLINCSYHYSGLEEGEIREINPSSDTKTDLTSKTEDEKRHLSDSPKQEESSTWGESLTTKTKSYKKLRRQNSIYSPPGGGINSTYH